MFIDYKFSVRNEAYRSTVELPSDRHIDSNVGETIDIRYLPSDPSVNYPDGWGMPIWGNLIPNLFLSMFPIMGVVGAAFLYRERRLARTGIVVDGKVTGCESNGTKFRVYYDFLTESNCTFEGVDNYSDEYEVDAKIRVIYLRSDPKRNDSYPMTSFRT